MTEIWGWPKCSVCYFVLSSPCFLFPSCHPGSLSSPSAMLAVWEVGVGFLSPIWLCGLRQNSYLLQYSPLARLHTLAWGGGDPWPSYLVQGCLLPTVPFFPPNKILLSLCQTKSDVQITCVLAHSKSIQGNGKALMGLSWVTGASNSVLVHCGN